MTVSLDAKEELEIDFEQLLSIWTTYLNKGFPKDVIKLEDNNICTDYARNKFEK